MSRIKGRAICAVLSLALFSGVAQAAPLDRPPTGIFGAAAVAVASTPYSAKWTRALNATLAAGNAISRSASSMSGLERLRFVNTAVNRATTFTNDARVGRQADNWATAGETLTRGAGDCEDYAIAKMQLLRSAGVPASDLFLVVGNDLSVRSAHAMLVVRLGAEYWVLDNFHNDVRQSHYYREFRPIVSFSANGSWLHGYRPGNAPNRIPAQRAAVNPAGEARLALTVAGQTGG